MAQCFLFEATFPASHGSYCKPQLQQDWAQASSHGGWTSPALAPPWDTQSPSEQAVPGPCSLCCQSHPQPAGSALQGAAQTHPSTAGSLPVPCRAQSLWQKRSRSFCIVWLSGDSVSPGEMLYRAPAAPIPARWRRDSLTLSACLLRTSLDLVWFKYLLAVNFGAWIGNSANTSLRNKVIIKTPHISSTEHSVKKTRILRWNPSFGVFEIFGKLTQDSSQLS